MRNPRRVGVIAFTMVVGRWMFPCEGAAARPCADPANPGLFPKAVLVQVVGGLDSPVAIEHAGDGSNRLFVVEQPGRIRIIRNGSLLPAPLLDIESKVRSGGEMGLLGLAFHPGYRKNGRFIVNYTSGEGGLHSVIAEYRVSADSPDRADPASARIVLVYDQPWENHNGGDVAFGPDGMLYIGTGDGGAGNDPKNSGQSLDTLLGKMLRIDVDRKDAGLEYAIPKDNPLTAKAGARPEIWAWGLRNPWRYSFDPVTGWLWAGDVGQNHWEEVDIIRRGANYGWRIMEGVHCTPGINKNCDTKGMTLPVHEYPRNEGVSVTGGEVYRGGAIPGLCGAYVFSDYGKGRIWALRTDRAGTKAVQHGVLVASARAISAFGTDEAHELYVADHSNGVILKLVGNDPAARMPEIGSVEKIAGGFQFIEGPVWWPAKDVLLFSDIPANRIMVWAGSPDVSSWREDSGNSNGLAFDPYGLLVACEHGNRRVSRTQADGTVVTLADRYQGKRLNSPNDLAISADRTIWFTDPPYGVEDKQRELAVQGVYRLDAAGKDLALVARDFIKPNGIALSPDGKTLYVSDTEGHHIRSFPVGRNHALGTGKVFADIRWPDGMKVDAVGRVWCTGEDGVVVFSASGARLGAIAFPEQPANCAFGEADGRTLFATARTGLYRVRVTDPD